MDDRLARVESTVHDLERSLAAVEARLAAIEGPPAPDGDRPVPAAAPAIASAAPAGDEAAAPPFVARDDLISVLSLVGRTFVALGGAYLLRALTDSAILPQAGGIALGLAYALAWLVMADRAGSARRASSAAFHALVASMIAFPLLWEATVRFKFLEPAATAAAVAVVTGLALGVAVRQRLQSLAWIATLAALPTALALIAATRVVVPFAVFLILLGIGTLWMGYALEWVLLRWPVALVADVAVLALTLRVSNRSWGELPAPVVAVQLFLLTGYLASIVTRTLVRARDVNVFEVVQSVAALAVGFGGAVYVASVTGSGVVLALAAGEPDGRRRLLRRGVRVRGAAPGAAPQFLFLHVARAGARAREQPPAARRDAGRAGVGGSRGRGRVARAPARTRGARAARGRVRRSRRRPRQGCWRRPPPRWSDRSPTPGVRSRRRRSSCWRRLPPAGRLRPRRPPTDPASTRASPGCSSRSRSSGPRRDGWSAC